MSEGEYSGSGSGLIQALRPAGIAGGEAFGVPKLQVNSCAALASIGIEPNVLQPTVERFMTNLAKALASCGKVRSALPLCSSSPPHDAPTRGI